MNGLKELLQIEERRLTNVKKIVESSLLNAPEGSLRVTTSGKSRQYLQYVKDAGGKQMTSYIKKENMNLVKALAQKGYDIKLQRLVNHRLSQVERLCREYEEGEIDAIYDGMHEIKRELIVPAIPTWEQRFMEWKNTPYKGKEFQPGTPEIYTIKGERVRSKSEKILADTFFHLGIEYKYECPVSLNGYGVVYPDFTFMSRKCDGILYWEHDGRMDDPKYAEKAVRKLDGYMKNGIFPGEKLIVTYETSSYPLNEKVVRKLIEKYLISPDR